MGEGEHLKMPDNMNIQVGSCLPIVICTALTCYSDQFQLEVATKPNWYHNGGLKNSRVKVSCIAASAKANSLSVTCAGETLWDCLPNGSCLGGAPTNAPIHLASLGTDNVAIISCIGNDELGNETIEILKGG